MKRGSPILNLQGLRIERGGTVILHEINWRVQRGQHWAVLGANGSGKTSLLSALTGYLMPTAGDIELLGERYGEYDRRELRCQIGLVSSSLRQMMTDHKPALHTVASGRGAVIDLWKPPTPPARRAAKNILKQMECGHLAERPWAVLSQGERQRLLIGRALMAQPKLLILDEPCAGLDPAAREHFLQFLNRLARRRNSPSLVLVTHHVEEITPAFSHALLLRGGRVLAQGRTKQVLSSALLSKTFDCRLKLQKVQGRCTLRVSARTERVV